MRILFTLLFYLFASIASAADDKPYLYILGVAQDAGYPQAGCYKPHCMLGWEYPNKRRGATSIALVDRGAGAKYLFEATPNFPAQLYALETEAPSSTYALKGIFLTHAHIGHYAGLMHLGREAMDASRVPVYAMPRMRKFLTDNGPWGQLVANHNIALQALAADGPVTLSSVTVTPFLVPHRDEYSETVGYHIKGPNKVALFIPDINKWTLWSHDIAEEIKAVDYALIDATFYDGNELPGRNMAEIPHPFVIESLKALEGLSAADRSKVMFIHFNHSNPLLDPKSPQTKAVLAAGYRIAVEGMKLGL